ncbi:pyridoxal 5'-phosphate synthase [Streptomyces sp. SCSIO 30461]|uniref:pyridoxine/pyridoxamine 5'-phosphate oxidase n=1 Tax=Streptomyces sp. SCSIO 30461 TaxID=3118085 RepID=UPI0030CBA968
MQDDHGAGSVGDTVHREGPTAAEGVDGRDMYALLRSLPVFADPVPVFDPEDVPADPVALFVRWLLAAIDAGVPSPHAAALATADVRGRPSARMLVCKDVDAAGRWYFASSATSRKGLEIAENPHAAMVFYWPMQARQIRITGPAASAGARRSAADFLARSPVARAEALLARQSQVLDDPAGAATLLRASQERLAAQPDLVASHWTLYALTAREAEFWQADDQRRHIRLRYRRTDTAWTRQRLWA